MYCQSKYNYILEISGEYCVYNTLYGGIIVLDADEYEVLSNGTTEKNSYTDTEIFFIDNGFWIEDYINETEQYLKFCEFMRGHKHDYVNAVIAVTTKCNARCFYCFEKGIIQKDMTIESADKVIDYLKSRYDINKTLSITWYGGEPLMNQEIISYITKELRKIYSDYSASMITNGLLFDDETIRKAVYDWKIGIVQITLDGTEEIYNSRKNYINFIESPFKIVINNIKKLTEHNIQVSIRLNIDDDNFDDIVHLLEFLRTEMAGIENLFIYPAVLNKNKFMQDSTSEERAMNFMEKIFTNFVDIINIERFIEVLPKIHTCMLDDDNAVSIGTDGKLYLCEHYIDKREYICDEKHLINMPVINSECYNCKILPKCLGGCYANRMENNLYCSIEKYCISTYLKEKLRNCIHKEK